MNRLLTIALLSACLCFANSLRAQEVRQANVKFAKSERPGLLADFPYSEGVVNAALHARLERSGFTKPKSEKGFSMYKAATWPEVSPGQLDVYAKVDGKGGKSTVILLVSKGYDNYVSEASDSMISARLKAFLNSLLPDIKAVQIQSDIVAQEEAIRRAERAYKDADEDGNKLAREKERLEQQQSANAAEKSKRGDALNAEKSKLDALKALVK